MADIFISYAREDRSRIEPLARSLEGLGWSVFWDRTIPAGKTWRQIIGEALKTTRSIIVAWSEISIESDWVQEEADRGRKRNILIPVLLDNVDPPLGFGAIQAADLVNWDPAQSSPEFEKLIADISVILGPSPKQIKGAEQAAEEEGNREQEEKRMLGEAEAARKAEEEAKRKKRAEEAERAKKAEAQRQAEEGRKIKQRPWLPILLISSGAFIGWAIGWAIVDGAIGGAILHRAAIVGGAIGGALGGVICYLLDQAKRRN